MKRPFDGRRSQRAALKFFASVRISRYTGGKNARPIGIKADAADGELRVEINQTIAGEIKVLKDLLYHYVIRNTALAAQEYGERQVITRLFNTLFEAAKRGSKYRDVIPSPFFEFASKNDETGNDDTRKRQQARLVADIISSLTEREALLLDQRLNGTLPGSVLDKIIS